MAISKKTNPTKVCVNAASGKMGQHVITILMANKNAKLVAALCRPAHRLLNRPVPHTDLSYSSDLAAGVAASDVVVDFSLPEATLKLVKAAIKQKKPILIGTTGFSEQQCEQIKNAAQFIPILMTPNTSIGVNSTMMLVAQAAKMVGKQADIEIVEAHHRHKVDAPSGTALRMGEAIAEAMGEKFDQLKVTEQRFGRHVRQKGEIGLSVIRAGEIIGDHKVIFALDNEIISIEHSAQNRHCFAEGAVEASLWLAKQKPGFYSMQDFLVDFS